MFRQIHKYLAGTANPHRVDNLNEVNRLPSTEQRGILFV
jgi:hypothetical protein